MANPMAELRGALDSAGNLLVPISWQRILVPGSIPITLDSVLPRRMGSGLWKYHDMVGYTSVGVGSCIVPVRINCPPEITLHHLRCGTASKADRAGETHRGREKAIIHR